MPSRPAKSMTGHHINLANAGWQTENGVSVRGSAYRHGTLLNSGALCAAARTIASEAEFASFLQELNGFFSIVIDRGEQIFAAVDIIRLGNCDVVLGNRIRSRAEALAGGMPLIKYLANRGLTIIENVFVLIS